MSEHSISDTNAAQDEQTRDEVRSGQYERGKRAAGQGGRKMGQAIAREFIDAVGRRDLSTIYYLEHLLAVMCEENEWVRRRLLNELENARKIA